LAKRAKACIISLKLKLSIFPKRLRVDDQSICSEAFLFSLPASIMQLAISDKQNFRFRSAASFFSLTTLPKLCIPPVTESTPRLLILRCLKLPLDPDITHTLEPDCFPSVRNPTARQVCNGKTLKYKVNSASWCTVLVYRQCTGECIGQCTGTFEQV
jgi:hypothetical protein